MDELELFTEALNLSDPAERAAFLDQACVGNPELRQRLEALLSGHELSQSPLDRPPLASQDFTISDSPATALLTGEHPPEIAAATIDRDDTDATLTASQFPNLRLIHDTAGAAIGTTSFGRYALVELIGQGGMGSVYRAHQTEPVKREVALKLIKSGMDSRNVLARFDAERQALALMDHPNIARIYDGGVTPAGQPFFVMELVHGVPLTDYCDQNHLSVKARLELFVSVCQAVQHAHQKGIIHRDLKPSNVLITEIDGRPTPKVIDFGVAKATEQRLTDVTLADTGAIVGTPAYMSPEQADPTSMDIDTRTDVYALGVILYELLTGSPPIEAHQFQRGAILEMLRMLREVDPPRPSTKLSHADALPNIAANRGIDPAHLTKLLQGELDWVVMKALEKDRTRRYDTANGLARDIQRYLADEVVEARPPSRGYRFKKFVKRNKIQVSAASLVFLTLVGGIVGTSLAMLAARRARDAEAAQRLVADAQRDKAIAAEARTKAINDFLTNDLLTQAEPANNAVEDKVTLLEVLDRAAEKVGTRFADQPDLEQSLRLTIAKTYHSLASWDKAEAQWRALLADAQTRDPQSTEFYRAISGLAHILRHRGRQDAEVLQMAEAAANGLESKLGSQHPETLISMDMLASAYKDAGQIDKALPLFEKTLKLTKARFGADHPLTLNSLNNLAGGYMAAGRLDKSLPLLEQTLASRKTKLGANHPDTLGSMNNLAEAYRAGGQLDKALALLEQTLTLMKANLGPDHPSTLVAMNNLADAYRSTQKLDNFLPFLEQALVSTKTKHGPDHPETFKSMINLAEGYRQAGDLTKALPLFEQAFLGRKAKLGPEHPDTIKSMLSLSACYHLLKRFDQSVPLFEEVLALQEKTLGRQHLETQRTVALLGLNEQDAGRFAEAVPLLEEAYRSSQKFPSLRWVGTPLLDGYIQAGKRAEATKLIGELVANDRKTLPKASLPLAGALARYGSILLQLGAFATAEPLLSEALAIREQTQPDAWNTFSTRSQRGAALLGLQKYAEAEPLLIQGYEGMKSREKSIPPQAIARLTEALDRLIDLSSATNKPDEVKKWRAERAKYPAGQTPATGQKK